MELKSVSMAFFSPGETTKKVCKTISKAFKDYPVKTIDLTDADAREKKYKFGENDVLIIGAPAYAGRIPRPEREALKKFTGKNTPVILAATYGNKALDDTLIELKNIMCEQGFVPIAAGAFPCQHSFLPELAAGRPDKEDKAKIKEFAAKIREKLDEYEVSDFEEIDVPGSFPYTKPADKVMPFNVETNSGCVYCMICANACPMKAIDMSNPFTINNDICERCGKCISVCPASAKYFTELPFTKLQDVLEKFVKTRIEPWTIIG